MSGTMLEDGRLPDSRPGRAVEWLLHHALTRGAEISEYEIGRMCGRRDEIILDNWRNGFGSWADRLGGEARPTEVLEETETSIRVVGEGGNGRTWEVEARLEEDAPHHLQWFRLMRALPRGVAIRPSRPDDAAALRAVARSAPLQLGDLTLTIDPGEDYFAGCRLMGKTAVTVVATKDDVPIGIHCGVTYPVRVRGEVSGCLLIAHSRLRPDFAGGGVWSRLNDDVRDRIPFGDTWTVSTAYIHPDNAAVQRMNGAQAKWPVRPVRLVFDCAQLAAKGGGRAHVARPATLDDAGAVTEIINRCHDGEELFVPYTEASLAERLGRAPELYSWDDILLGNEAAVGVWASGEVRILERAGEVLSSASRAIALDYGFLPGAEGDLAGLLEAWCLRLAARGISHLGLFSSSTSPGYQALKALACAEEPYDLVTPRIADIPSAQGGVYTDPVYF